MESTRIWLARTIEKDLGSLTRGLEGWLGADASLAMGDRLAAVCPTTLRDLVQWLRGAAPVRRSLPGDRASALAQSFVLEFLKQEGCLDRVSRERRLEVLLLLESFFAAAATG